MKKFTLIMLFLFGMGITKSFSQAPDCHNHTGCTYSVTVYYVDGSSNPQSASYTHNANSDFSVGAYLSGLPGGFTANSITGYDFDTGAGIFTVPASGTTCTPLPCPSCPNGLGAQVCIDGAGMYDITCL